MAVDHYVHEHLDSIKGALQRNVRGPDISFGKLYKFTKKQIQFQFSNVDTPLDQFEQEALEPVYPEESAEVEPEAAVVEEAPTAEAVTAE